MKGPAVCLHSSPQDAINLVSGVMDALMAPIDAIINKLLGSMNWGPNAMGALGLLPLNYKPEKLTDKVMPSAIDWGNLELNIEFNRYLAQ